MLNIQVKSVNLQQIHMSSDIPPWLKTAGIVTTQGVALLGVELFSFGFLAGLTSYIPDPYHRHSGSADNREPFLEDPVDASITSPNTEVKRIEEEIEATSLSGFIKRPQYKGIARSYWLYLLKQDESEYQHVVNIFPS